LSVKKKVYADNKQAKKTKSAAIELFEAKTSGRPTKYIPEFDSLAYFQCLLNATNNHLCEFFGINEQTLINWQKKHPSFLEAVHRGRVEADQAVINATLKKATGFEREEEVIFSTKDGLAKEKIIKYYPPDSKAQEFWLTNRHRHLFSRKDHVEVEANVNHEVKHYVYNLPKNDRLKTEIEE